MPKGKPKSVAPPSSYQSRADLQAQIAKLNRMVDRQRKQLVAKPIIEADDDEDDSILPDVQDEALPTRGRRTSSMSASANGQQGQIVIHPTAYIRSLFSKQRRGLGGFQSLHAAIQSRMAGSKEMRLSSADFSRIVNYATNYGEGGFQQSLRWLVARWVSEQLETGSMNLSK